jgi:hypothetical protein
MAGGSRKRDPAFGAFIVCDLLPVVKIDNFCKLVQTQHLSLQMQIRTGSASITYSQFSNMPLVTYLLHKLQTPAHCCKNLQFLTDPSAINLWKSTRLSYSESKTFAKGLWRLATRNTAAIEKQNSIG